MRTDVLRLATKYFRQPILGGIRFAERKLSQIARKFNRKPSLSRTQRDARIDAAEATVRKAESQCLFAANEADGHE